MRIIKTIYRNLLYVYFFLLLIVNVISCKIKIHARFVEAVETDLYKQRFPEAVSRRTSSLRPRRYTACVTIRNPSFNDRFCEKFRIDLFLT